MPNTLAHIALHTPLTRAAVRGADARWILLGCVLSDLPWILQRAMWFLAPGVDRYDLRLYCIVQASLLVSLLLAGAFAALSAKPKRTFTILSIGVALHLLMDACQYKWGNAVHMLAPFSWASLNFDLFWPEHVVTLALTVGGLVAFVFAIRGSGWEQPLLNVRRIPAALLLAAYLLVPLAFIGAAERSGTHSIDVFRDVANRTGKRVEIDRRPLENGVLTTFSGEKIKLGGWGQYDGPALVSVRGLFVSNSTLLVEGLYEHRFKRNWASYSGLALVALGWLWPVLRKRRTT